MLCGRVDITTTEPDGNIVNVFNLADPQYTKVLSFVASVSNIGASNNHQTFLTAQIVNENTGAIRAMTPNGITQTINVSWIAILGH